MSLVAVSVIIAMCVVTTFYQSLLGEAINLWVPYTNPTKDVRYSFLLKIEHLLTLNAHSRCWLILPFTVWLLWVCAFLGFSHFVRIDLP